MRALYTLLFFGLAACGSEASNSVADSTPTSSAPPASTATAASKPNAELSVGDTAPAFNLMGSDGNQHALSDYAGQHVVVAFFPKAFTGG